MEENEILLKGKDEIAQVVGVSWPTIRKLILEDHFPAMKLGKTWTASPAAIREWRHDRLRYRGGKSDE